jgi:peptide/nickel transport system permease protein
VLRFLVRRVVEALVLVVGVTLLTFALLSTIAGSVARQIVGQTAPASAVQAKALELGLDRPFFVRYLEWLAGAVHGDFGVSWFSSEPVNDLLAGKAPITVSLVVAAIVVSTVISVAFGVVAAVRGGWLDRALQAVALVGFSFPSFVLGLILAVVFAVQLGLLPALGYVPFTQSPGGWLASILLPTIALAVQVVASTSQQVRGSMVDVLQSDFVRTLRSRGISAPSLYLKHGLRSAAPPALTVLGLQTIGLIGGTVVVEKVFGLLGLGTAIVSASAQGDQPIVMGVVTIMVLIIVLINLLLDVAYAWLNPKVRTR